MSSHHGECQLCEADFLPKVTQAQGLSDHGLLSAAEAGAAFPCGQRQAQPTSGGTGAVRARPHSPPAGLVIPLPLEEVLKGGQS